MTIRDHKERYKVETKIHPRPVRNYTLDNGMFTHRVDDRQPIEYGIEGLKYKEPLREQGSKTVLQNTKYL